MKKNLILLGGVLLMFTACAGMDAEVDDSQNEIYKKAVVKLVKEQKKTISVNKELIDYSKDEK